MTEEEKMNILSLLSSPDEQNYKLGRLIWKNYNRNTKPKATNSKELLRAWGVKTLRTKYKLRPYRQNKKFSLKFESGLKINVSCTHKFNRQHDWLFTAYADVGNVRKLIYFKNHEHKNMGIVFQTVKKIIEISESYETKF